MSGAPSRNICFRISWYRPNRRTEFQRVTFKVESGDTWITLVYTSKLSPLEFRP